MVANVATLLPNGEQTFTDGNGVPLSGGFVYMYIAPNTTTLKDTWQNRDHSVLNTNPIVLDSAGRAIIYGLGRYRQILKDQFGVQIWDEQVEAVIAETVYDLPVFIEGSPSANEEYPIVNIVRDCYLPEDLVGTLAAIDVNPTVDMEFSLRKNGVEIGTFTFDSAGAVTIVFAAQVNFEAGDQFSIIAPASPDATGTGISITIVWVLG